MGKTHFDQVVGETGVFVGPNGSEVQVADTSGDLYIQGTKITATAAELNAAAGTGVSSAELGYLDGATEGTQVASKCVIADANINTGISKITELHIGATGSETQVTSTAAELNLLDGATAGTQVASVAVIADANVNTGVSKVTELHIGASGSETQVNATAAELNKNDVSAETETGIAAAGTVSAAIGITQLDSNAGAGAVTLAAPDATMLGKVKIIEMTVAGNALTMALTNVQGGSAATTASFDAVDETLVLVGGTNKWTVLAEAGVTLS